MTYRWVMDWMIGSSEFIGLLFNKYCNGDQVKRNEMGEHFVAYSRVGGQRPRNGV
jgi:hypothetical protein